MAWKDDFRAAKLEAPESPECAREDADAAMAGNSGCRFARLRGAWAEGRTMPSHRVREAGARQEPLKIQAPKLGSNKRSHGNSLAFLHSNVNQLARFQVIPVVSFMY
ncbi:hypothetical protein [Brucella intermedia]|uniref:Uncharacterized protein n=1 Tax=Brucella intermedia TaxID=94625 RepID=A0A7V6TZG5_9HYPH|nr:hypothetical protein [Brucella intermedia]WGG61132.1 hypothetical protein QA414_20805 [Brucella intermedia]HHV67926.1 hypothetical protein [Brucella intermedia]